MFGGSLLSPGLSEAVARRLRGGQWTEGGSRPRNRHSFQRVKGGVGGGSADVDRPGIDWVGLSTVQFILCRLRRNICLNSGTRAVIHVRLTRGYFLPNEGKGMLKFYFPSRAAFIKNSPTVSERREPRNNSKWSKPEGQVSSANFPSDSSFTKSIPQRSQKLLLLIMSNSLLVIL